MANTNNLAGGSLRRFARNGGRFQAATGESKPGRLMRRIDQVAQMARFSGMGLVAR